jgi:hypothetical protein
MNKLIPEKNILKKSFINFLKPTYTSKLIKYLNPNILLQGFAEKVAVNQTTFILRFRINGRVCTLHNKFIFRKNTKVINIRASQNYRKRVQSILYAATSPVKCRKRTATKFSLIKINITRTTFGFLYTTLQGHLIKFYNTSSAGHFAKKIRMTKINLIKVLHKFMKALRRLRRKTKLRKVVEYTKLVFIGPSRRFRVPIMRKIFQKCRRLGILIVSIEDNFRPAYNGLRLSRRKR